MTAERDWADKEAAELIAFVKEFGDADALEVIATRLRVVRCLGVNEGIESASEALKRTWADTDARADLVSA